MRSLFRRKSVLLFSKKGATRAIVDPFDRNESRGPQSMRKHGARAAYYILGKGVFRDPDYLTGANGCPVAPRCPMAAKPMVTPNEAAASGATTDAATAPAFRFGFMFRDSVPQPVVPKEPDPEAIAALMDPSRRMNRKPPDPANANSDIPSGYTYLGQLIAHEITFDNSKELPDQELKPETTRSP